MQNFYEKHQEEGVEIIAVNLTNIDHGKEGIKTFIQDYELTFAIPPDG